MIVYVSSLMIGVHVEDRVDDGRREAVTVQVLVMIREDCHVERVTKQTLALFASGDCSRIAKSVGASTRRTPAVEMISRANRDRVPTGDRGRTA